MPDACQGRAVCGDAEKHLYNRVTLAQDRIKELEGALLALRLYLSDQVDGEAHSPLTTAFEAVCLIDRALTRTSEEKG